MACVKVNDVNIEAEGTQGPSSLGDSCGMGGRKVEAGLGPEPQGFWFSLVSEMVTQIVWLLYFYLYLSVYLA